ncbi:hypothetical protein ISF26_24340 (plasmid) [Gloeobacter morelensis MG652769]|nr:hypothetical protein ISF26_24340 [Gloeobacter morelensis MG652769]
MTAGVITVFAHSSRFNEDYHSASASWRLGVASSFTPALQRSALELARKLWREGVEFAKAGVLLGEIGSEDAVQLSLFSTFEIDDEEPRRLMASLDALNGE